MTVRAKFKVNKITQHEGGSVEVSMQPVTSGSPENEQFFKWTPFGQLSMGTINADAAKEFTPGAQFYVDFTPA